jgi:carbon dioxide concentrating mechanism protein CcmN
MYLPPLQAMHDSQAQSIGDVTVHPSAAIAPGVLLQAEEGSQIIIAASVCLGMGTVLHAYNGTLEIREGANLGAGVLIIGSGTIGSHACIGTSSTIIESSVQSQQILPPGSLLGDRSRSTQSESKSNESRSDESQSNPSTSNGASAQTPLKTSSVADPWASDSENSADQPAGSQQHPTPNSSNGSARTAPIHGKDYVNNLLSTLLPHRANLGPSSES